MVSVYRMILDARHFGSRLILLVGLQMQDVYLSVTFTSDMQCSYIMFHIPRWLTRVPNRFGGKRDLAFFRGDIRDLN